MVGGLRVGMSAYPPLITAILRSSYSYCTVLVAVMLSYLTLPVLPACLSIGTKDLALSSFLLLLLLLLLPTSSSFPFSHRSPVLGLSVVVYRIISCSCRLSRLQHSTASSLFALTGRRVPYRNLLSSTTTHSISTLHRYHTGSR